MRWACSACTAPCTANYAVNECDLLIAVGARFDDRVTGKLSAFAPKAKIIHIDIDPAEIGKNVEPMIPIVGDAKHVLAALAKELEALEWSPERLDAWWAKLRAWQDEYPLHYEDPTDGTLAPQFVIQEIDRVTESPRSSAPTSASTRCGRPSTTRTRSRDSGSARAAWGRWASACRRPSAPRSAGPTRTVIDIAGDGSFQMTIQELATAVNYDVPVKVAILNNGYLGMVRQWQELFWNKRYSHTHFERQPDFKMLAEAYGAVGMAVTEKDQVADALREAIACGRPAVIDFKVAGEENVYPMVPAGSSITEMIGGVAPRRRKKS